MTRVRTLLLLAALVLVTLNLRPAIVAVSPLLDEIRASTGMSGAEASLLTTLPVFCFGALAPLAPRLARRFGGEAVIAGAMVVLAAGIVVRVVPGTALLIGGTVLIGGAIAVCNVLVPSVIKRDLPHIAGLAMGVYAMALTGGAALAAGLAIPVEDALGTDWRGGLVPWVLPVVLALVAWLPVVRIVRARGEQNGHAAMAGGLWRDPVAWAVTGFMGLQTLQFYTATAWVPTIFVDHGMTQERAGLLLALMNVVGVGSALAAPVLAGRMRRQVGLGVGSVAFWAAAWIGMLAAPVGGALLWMVLMGVAQGATLGVALTLMVLRSPDAAHTAELSGMAQTVGYLVGGFGPLAIGALHDATGDWQASIAVLLVLLVPLTAVAVLAGRARLVRGGAA
ncbi:CynX/NimT family MFS transporter [Patulibacter americanus]|uniref:CynX/NimT family MFS transporter n=1 Tax=Patulibacter americanus TaxID=588672 RepID=UPI0003B785CD|nr:MFS transporter [Patulibacter americanus]